MNYYEVSNYINTVNGFMGSQAQREFMFNLGKITNKAAEIGSYKGLSAAIVVLGMVTTHERQIIPSYYCIDTFESSNKELNDESTYQEFCNVINNVDKYGIVKTVKGYSTDEKTLSQIPNDLDWVYVDGDHETDQVIKDIRSYVPFIKNDGLMLFHDHTWDSVLNAIKIGIEENLIEFVCSFDDFGIYKKK